MQPNGKLLRDKRVSINLNHWEHQCLESLSNIIGLELGTLARNLVLQRAKEALSQQSEHNDYACTTHDASLCHLRCAIAAFSGAAHV